MSDKYLTRLDRNNTNFTLQLVEYFKKHKWGNEYNFLKYYQNIVRMFINDVDIDARGILCTLEMGLGKSIVAMSIAMDMIKTRQPIVLLTKSLQKNMRGAIIKYVKLRKEHDPDYYLCRLSQEDLEKWIDRNFSFVSMNASNMLKQMGKAAEGRVLEELDSALEKKFGEVLKLPSLDGKLLIVDEAHNLFRAITNGSKNAIGLYDLVVKSKNLKVMFFTGTPIANDPFELVPCFNMLGSKIPGKITLPENYKDFNKLFVDDKNGRIKNKDKFQNRILGLVSHVSHKSTPGAGIGIGADSTTKVEIPEELPTIVEKVPMDAEQYVIYQLARDKEKEEGTGKGMGNRFADTPAMTKPKSTAASSYRVKSRQLSNYCPPAGLREVKDPEDIPLDKSGSPKYEKIYQNILKHKNQLGIMYSQFVGPGGLGTFQRFLQSHGWVEVKISTGKRKLPAEDKIMDLEHAGPGEQGELDEYIDNPAIAESDESSPEIVGNGLYETDSEYRNLLASRTYKYDILLNGPALPSVDAVLNNIDSELTKVPEDVWWMRGGLDKGTNEYDYNDNINDYNDDYNISDAFGGAQPAGRFAVISGDVDVEDRSSIQDMFNSDENKHGGIIDLIMLSSTGAEGLDLKNVRHIHILEPYWNWGRIAQIKARGVRNDSHIALPKEEKNVQPYVYLAVPPTSETLPTGEIPPTTDTELYYESVTNQVTIESFNEALKEVSIECVVNGEKHCRVCNPTNSKLTTDDIERDIRGTDPCSQISEAQIKAEEIIINDEKYYYTPDPNSIYDYKIFIYDATIDSYRQLRESDPKFAKIIDAIEKEKNKE
jgi:superfamily II DNA or RNA helicase